MERAAFIQSSVPTNRTALSPYRAPGVGLRARPVSVKIGRYTFPIAFE